MRKSILDEVELLGRNFCFQGLKTFFYERSRQITLENGKKVFCHVSSFRDKNCQS
jgi:hypothetical protein